MLRQTAVTCTCLPGVSNVTVIATDAPDWSEVSLDKLTVHNVLRPRDTACSIARTNRARGFVYELS